MWGPTGLSLRPSSLSTCFHLVSGTDCYVDDSQIYVLLKKKDAYSVKPLLRCLDDIKAWMAINFLNFNEKKTEVMVFDGTTGAPLIDLGSLAQFIKPTVTDLGVKVDADLKLDCQISSVVKSSFLQLRQPAKIKPILSRQHFETVIHAFVTTRLDYCNALYAGVSGSRRRPSSDGAKCCCTSFNWHT